MLLRKSGFSLVMSYGMVSEASCSVEGWSIGATGSTGAATGGRAITVSASGVRLARHDGSSRGADGVPPKLGRCGVDVWTGNTILSSGMTIDEA